MAKFNGPLSNPPIVYGLCQIQFATVGSVEAGIQAIHEPLRGDYPHRSPEDVSELQLSQHGVTAAPIQYRRWSMIDRPKTSGFILSPTALIYHTTAYRTFEYFLGQTLRGLRGVVEHLRPAVIDRIGLRFVDLIEAEAGTIDRYIERPLHGFEPNVEGFELQVQQQVIRGRTRQGELVFRISRARHSAPLPADLLPVSLKLREPAKDEESIFIDIDHFRANADADPDPEVLGKLILDLQGPMSTLFKDAVTEHAIKVWNTPRN